MKRGLLSWIAILCFGFVFIFSFLSASITLAASPSGDYWFQLLANPFTGGDNTGDGGTGNTNDLNYYYVGQTFLTTIQIQASSTNAANIWIDYQDGTTTASNLMTGTFFPSWAAQTIAGGRVKSTGYQAFGYASGLGSFGTVQWTLDKPSEAAYGVGAPEILDINVGTIGNTTESNISKDGFDMLNSSEDFQMHVWADTKKPYAKNVSPSSSAIGVPVDDNYLFDLIDSKNGEGDDSGVGTGVNTATPPGSITINSVDFTAWDSYFCIGIWSTNLCHVTINPPSPTGIAGDQRNWDYNTTYIVNVNGFQDLASSNQDQLGDANGPNMMDAKSWSFTTEADSVAPKVTTESPVRNSVGNPTSTPITIDVLDLKTYPGNVSGSGVNATSCKMDVWSANFATTTYQLGSAGITAMAIDYGYRYTIIPASSFGENQIVYVKVYNCADLSSNVMTDDLYSFNTIDDAPPFVDQINPANDTAILTNATISFHIKDKDGGVDVTNTVIYVNGVYYTFLGGAGAVTTNGTKITFANSLKFTGGNYPGDTTSLSGSAVDYAFHIDPQADFAQGESVPIAIYSRDNNGNIMERVIYGLFVNNSSSCVVQQSPSGGGSPSLTPLSSVNIYSIQAVQVDETTILVSWLSNQPATSRVVYGPNSLSSIGVAPNYGYSNSTAENTIETTIHSVIVNNLTPGQVYAFRPVSKTNGQEIYGPEILMSPVFATKIVDRYASSTIGGAPQICPTPKPVYITVPSVGGTGEAMRGAAGSFAGGVGQNEPGTIYGLTGRGYLKILDIQKYGIGMQVSGVALPNAKLKVLIY